MIRREESPLPPFRQGGLMVQRFTVCTTFMFGGKIIPEQQQRPPLPSEGSARRAVGDSVV